MASFLPPVHTIASSSVKDDEFNSFHSIDRKLFIRLIVNLNRDPFESMQVMAFWLWLEQDVVGNLTLVYKMLSLSGTLVNQLADESVMCLKCVESDTFLFGGKDRHELMLLPSFVQRNISFQYFYENRIGVLHGVSRLMREVCSRAFHDLLEKNICGVKSSPNLQLVEEVGETSSSFGQFGTISRSHGGVRNPNTPLVDKVGEASSSFGQLGTIFSRRHGLVIRNPNLPLKEKVGESSLSFGEVDSTSQIHGGARNPNPPSVGKVGESSSSFEVGNSSNVMRSWAVVSVVQTPPINVAAATFPYWLSSYNCMPPVPPVLSIEEQIMENELCHRVNASLKALMEENDEVSPDERTIFLTFSKGYPLSETEVREFFTRKFGDFIEAIHMQEVAPNEQILYARVVARSPSALHAVVEGGRVKYTINGKHVWARKYERKQNSPPRNVAFCI